MSQRTCALVLAIAGATAAAGQTLTPAERSANIQAFEKVWTTVGDKHWDPKLGGSDRWRAILAYLVRARMLKPDGRVVADYDGAPTGAPAGALPWFAIPKPAWATHTVVFDHWAALGLDLGKHHTALDTGCVWGKSLTAMRLDDRSVFQVKAVET